MLTSLAQSIPGISRECHEKVAFTGSGVGRDLLGWEDTTTLKEAWGALWLLAASVLWELKSAAGCSLDGASCSCEGGAWE